VSLSVRTPEPRPSPARIAAALLLVALASATTVALAQARTEAPGALTAVRVVDAATGDVLATLSDGDTLDLSDSAVRTVVLEPLDVAEATRSVAYSIDGERITVVNAPPFTLGDRDVAEGLSGTLELPVLRSEDDAEEFIDASMRDPEQFPAGFTYHTSSDLDLVFDPNHSRQVVGIRFDDVDLPPNATITAAAIVFTADGAQSGDVTLTIRGERDGASQPFPQDAFETGTSSISTRQQTVAVVTWPIEEEWRNNRRYETPDLTALVQEILNSPDWRPGAPLTFIIEGAEGPALRRAYSYDGRRDTPARVPMLLLSYSAPPEAVAAPVTLPEGESTLIVTPYGRWSAAGEEGPPLRARILTAPTAPDVAEPVDPVEPAEPDEPAADAAAPEPAPEPEPEAEPPAEPEEPAAAAEPPADEPLADATAVPPAAASASGTITPLWDSDVRGTIFVERDDATGGARVTVELTEPAAAPLSLEIRRGTCSAPGDVLARLAPVGVGERSSASTVPTSATALRFSGFVVFVRSGTPVGCGQIAP
jgi:hypothetical protein